MVSAARIADWLNPLWRERVILDSPLSPVKCREVLVVLAGRASIFDPRETTGWVREDRFLLDLRTGNTGRMFNTLFTPSIRAEGRMLAVKKWTRLKIELRASPFSLWWAVLLYALTIRMAVGEWGWMPRFLGTGFDGGRFMLFGSLLLYPLVRRLQQKQAQTLLELIRIVVLGNRVLTPR